MAKNTKRLPKKPMPTEPEFSEQLPVTVLIDVCPKPQPRHRVTINPRTKRAIAYIPKRNPIHAYKLACRIRMRMRMQSRFPLYGPLVVECLFVLPKPKKSNSEVVLHHTRPDIDNLEKALFDSAKSILWKDDAQITQSKSVKRYTFEGEQPFVRMTVRPATDVDVEFP